MIVEYEGKYYSTEEEFDRETITLLSIPSEEIKGEIKLIITPEGSTKSLIVFLTAKGSEEKSITLDNIDLSHKQVFAFFDNIFEKNLKVTQKLLEDGIVTVADVVEFEDRKDQKLEDSSLKSILLVISIIVIISYGIYYGTTFHSNQGLVLADIEVIETGSKMLKISPKLTDGQVLKIGDYIGFIPNPNFDTQLASLDAEIEYQKKKIKTLISQELTETSFWEVRGRLNDLNYDRYVQEMILSSQNFIETEKKFETVKTLVSGAFSPEKDLEEANFELLKSKIDFDLSQTKVKEAYVIMNSKGIHTSADSLNSFESVSDEVSIAKAELSKLKAKKEALEKQREASKIYSPCDCMYLVAWVKHKDYPEQIRLIQMDNNVPAVYPVFPIKIGEVEEIVGGNIGISIYDPVKGKMTIETFVDNWVYKNSSLIGLPETWRLENMETLQRGVKKLSPDLIGHSISIRQIRFKNLGF